MNKVSLKAFSVILVSLGLALIFNLLFFEKWIGISVFIFNAILLGVVFFFSKREKLSVKKSWWLFLSILFFTLMAGSRANEFLNFLNVCAAFGLLLLLTQELTGSPAYLMKVRDYLFLVILGPLKMIARAFYSVSLIGEIRSNSKHRDVWVRVIKGAVMAAPVLIIFGILFSQADIVFSRFMKGIFNITITERAIQYFVLFSFSFAAALSFLSYIFIPKNNSGEQISEKSERSASPGRRIEVLVFLGLISVLFLLFIVFQVAYLFGGQANIIDAGFTYAEYARRGFWELLAVAALSLLVLYASEKYAGKDSAKDRKFLVASLFLIAEVMIIIFSAAKRLALYIDAYSLTEQRFYAAGFIALLSALFILLAFKLIKAKPEQFLTFGALLSLMAFIAAVNMINPDAFITKFNVEQYNRTGKLDVAYIGNLSPDAAPQQIELYNKLEGEDKEVLKNLLQKQKDRLQKHSGEWQSFNFSRGQSLKMLQSMDK